MGRIGVLAVSVLATAASLVGSAPAQAEGWMPGVDVTGPVLTGVGGVVSDGAGTTTVAWVASDNDREPEGTLRVRRAAPDGTPGPAQVVGQIPAGDVADLVSSPAGDATVVAWPAPTAVAGEVDITLTSVRSNGQVDPARVVATVAALEPGSVRVGVDARGNATVAWLEGAGPGVWDVRASRMPAVGNPPVAETLAAGVDRRATPQVVVAPDGVVSVGWIVTEQGAEDAYDVRIVRVSPVGAFGAPQTALTARGSASQLSMSASVSGAVATWLAFGPGEFEFHDIRGVRLSPAGQVTGDLDVAGKSGMLGLPHSSTIAPNGTVTVGWSRYVAADEARVRVRQFAPDGTPTPARDLGGAHPMEGAVRVVAAPDGAVFVAWAGTDLTVDDGGVVVARRIGPAGGAGPETTLGTAAAVPGDDFSRTVSLAPDGVGGATVGWYAGNAFTSRYRTATYDGTAPSVQVTAPGTVGVGDPVAFNTVASDRFGVASYRWEFGDGGGDPRAAAVHRYAQAGSYPVVLTVADPAGNETVVRRTINVTAPAPGGGSGGGGAPGPGPGSSADPPAVKRLRAGLKLSKVTRKGSKFTVSGTISRKASGKIVVTYAQRIKRKTTTVKRTVKIVKGKFRVTLQLPRKVARVKTGSAKLQVRYAGNRTVAGSTLTRTIKLQVKKRR